MKGIIFFVYLALLLLGTYNAIGVHQNKFSSFHHSAKANQLKFNSSNESYAFKEDDPGEEPEDDKINNLFAKKYRLLSRFDFQLCDAIHSNSLYGGVKGPLVFNRYIPGIYIVQRALRI
jgi:hypothetical protein